MHMAEEREYLSIPGHVPVKEAAELLDISEDRVLQHIKANRLRARKVNGRYMIVKTSVDSFQHNPPGRIRTKAPAWRIYNARSKLYSLDIQVKVHEGQQEQLQKRLTTMQEKMCYTFPGTLARYIFKDDPAFGSLRIWLIWKDNEMPDKHIWTRHLEAFKADLAAVLDWETATFSTREGLIYT